MKKYKLEKEYKKPLKELINNTKDLFKKAVRKRVSKNKKIGLLFSGGVDSTLIGVVLKKLGVNFTCYTSGTKNSPDMEWAEKTAGKHGFRLKKTIFDEKKVQKELVNICSIIKSNNPVKVGVAIPFYFSLKQASKDGVSLVFTGLGSEEIYAGYQRFEGVKDVNKECLHGLNTIQERDLDRDTRLLKHFGIKPALPFLDDDLIKDSLRIPGKYKINNEYKKIIIRYVAEEAGVIKSVSWRKKKAAQYGSKSDKMLGRLSREYGSRTIYLKTIYGNKPRYGVLYSGGKDSNLALFKAMKEYDILCLITMIPERSDSYMFHPSEKNIIELQAKSMNVPVVFGKTRAVKEKELIDLKELIKTAKHKFKLNGIVTGALYSSYQANRIKKICKELKLKCYSPLWHMSQEEELKELLKYKFEFILTSVAGLGLNKSWLNTRITESHIKKLKMLEEKYGLNMAGEGGEYESLVLKAPYFNKRLKITNSKIIEEDEHTARLVIKNVVLE